MGAGRARRFRSSRRAPPSAAHHLSALTGRVVDQADLLSPAQEAELTRKLEALQRASSRQLVVATVPSLQDLPIEDYGYQLGRAWRIGQQGANNGVILIVAPNETQGADRGRLRARADPDRRAVEPDHRAATSCRASATTIIRAGSSPAPTRSSPSSRRRPRPPSARVGREPRRATAAAPRRAAGRRLALPLIFWVVVICSSSSRDPPRHRRQALSRPRRGWGGPIVHLGPGPRGGGSWGGGGWWGGGGGSSWGGGGGGFSGGGGSFGGGGASGGW